MKYFFTFLLFLFTALNTSYAKIYLNINQGSVAPIVIGLPNFLDSEKKSDIFFIIKNDLLKSGFFLETKPIYSQPSNSLVLHPDFSLWPDAHVLITGSVTQKNSIISVKCFLYDVAQKKIIDSIYKKSFVQNIRYLAHDISNKIYQDLIGFPGYFNTKIAFISSLKNPRVAIMDFDGYNFKYLTDGREDVLSPRLSPNGRFILYVQYDQGIPRIHVRNLISGKEQIIGPMYGATFAPRWSYDNKYIYFSFSFLGNSDIYVMDLSSQRVRRLTNDGSINVSPSASPDGKWVAYSSDKSGRSQIYILNLKTKYSKRITFHDGSYFTPVWSPDGRWIAFTCFWKDKYFIGVMDPEGKQMHFLSDGYYQENPAWDPAGHMLLFPREATKKEANHDMLYVMDVAGYHISRLHTKDVAFDPSWSLSYNK